MDWLTLIRSPRLGNAGALRLLQPCGSAAGCFTSYIPASLDLHSETRAWRCTPDRSATQQGLEWMRKIGAQLASEQGRDEAAAPEHPEYRQLLNSPDFAPTSVDALVERTGLTPDGVSSMLLTLELQGHVEASPGGRYSRVNKRS